MTKENEMETTKAEPIQLNFESKRQVVVSPDDKDRFVTTEGDAAKACKRAENDNEFKDQFLSFLSHLHDQCLELEEKVRACYVTVGDSSLNVLLCLHEEGYNFDFEDTVVELDVDFAKRFPLCVFEILQIPNQTTLTNELPGEALCVYGDGKRPQEASGT